MTLRTEEEARKCWCPFARTLEAAEGGSASVNREVGNYDKEGNETVVIAGRHRCVASQCAAWRWGELLTAREADEVGGTATGFCGLAGVPTR